MYLCRHCLVCSIADELVIDGRCPDCGQPVERQCSRDHPCTCGAEMHDTIAYCPECGKAVCPGCGCHDVAQISRITGYLQDVAGWNAGKRQELKDRTRYGLDGAMAPRRDA